MVAGRTVTERYGVAPAQRGDVVAVHEPNREPLVGRVLSVKPSSVSGWWLEIATESGAWCFAAATVEIETLAEVG